jgi:hypothetical protein
MMLRTYVGLPVTASLPEVETLVASKNPFCIVLYERKSFDVRRRRRGGIYCSEGPDPGWATYRLTKRRIYQYHRQHSLWRGQKNTYRHYRQHGTAGK